LNGLSHIIVIAIDATSGRTTKGLSINNILNVSNVNYTQTENLKMFISKNVNVSESQINYEKE